MKVLAGCRCNVGYVEVTFAKLPVARSGNPSQADATDVLISLWPVSRLWEIFLDYRTNL